MKLVVMYAVCVVCEHRFAVQDYMPLLSAQWEHCGVAMNYVSAPVETVHTKELV